MGKGGPTKSTNIDPPRAILIPQYVDLTSFLKSNLHNRTTEGDVNSNNTVVYRFSFKYQNKNTTIKTKSVIDNTENLMKRK